MPSDLPAPRPLDLDGRGDEPVVAEDGRDDGSGLDTPASQQLREGGRPLSRRREDPLGFEGYGSGMVKALDDRDDDKENRMIKVNVMYPYTEGARFDHAYYRDRHMPMVKARLGNACAYYTIEKGLAGGAPGTPPAFVAMCAFICDSAEGYQAALREHGAEIRGDIANYTDIAPVLQVSEIVVERSDR